MSRLLAIAAAVAALCACPIPDYDAAGKRCAPGRGGCPNGYRCAAGRCDPSTGPACEPGCVSGTSGTLATCDDRAPFVECGSELAGASCVGGRCAIPCQAGSCAANQACDTADDPATCFTVHACGSCPGDRVCAPGAGNGACVPAPTGTPAPLDCLGAAPDAGTARLSAVRVISFGTESPLSGWTVRYPAGDGGVLSCAQNAAAGLCLLPDGGAALPTGPLLLSVDDGDDAFPSDVRISISALASGELVLRVPRKADHEAWRRQLGVALRPGQGTVFARVADCGWTPVSGATLALTQGIAPAYLVRSGGLVDVSTSEPATTPAGEAAFYAVPPYTGSALGLGARGADGGVLTLSVPASVSPGRATVVELTPGQ